MKLVFAKCSDLDYGYLHRVIGFCVVQFVLGFLAACCDLDVVSGLLIEMTVNVADPPDVGVLTLFDHDTVTHNDIMLFGINHQCTTTI